jgi:hypothetical protein
MKQIHLLFARVFPLDKVLHFSVSYFIASVGLQIFGWKSIPIAILAGVIKEVSDELYFNGWSWGDVIFNFLGIGIALLIYLTT